ncbi:MAG: hypothetical protein ACYCYI_09335 [Saccharofermentanales bacterium]
MKKRFFSVLVSLLCISVISVMTNFRPDPVYASFTNYITLDSTTHDKLKDGANEFRFMGMNIQAFDPVWLVGYPRWDAGAYKNPTDYELEDIIKTVAQMGGTVVRDYSLSVGATVNGVERHVMAVDTFSDEAFARLDRIFELCNEYGIRLILGLVDYQDTIGGVSTYSGWRSKTKDEFFTDATVIADFKKTIDFVTNRYKDEKALLCWETGNEFPINANTDSWTRTISAYIKSKDPNHLVADGRLGISNDSLTNSNVDIVVNHLYHWVQGYDYDQYCSDDKDATTGKKAYIVEEFGYAGADQTIYHDLLTEAISNGTSGVMLWALAHHNDKGGFYWHDGYYAGVGDYWTYHWPGFASGSSYNEIDTLTLMRNHAYEIRGLSVPSISTPDTPEMLPIDSVRCINWRGSTGANSYDIERATSINGPWTLVGDNISDATKWAPALFDDKSAIGGTAYYYRVKANNTSGTSSASNVVGPVTASNTYTFASDYDENYVNGYKGWYYQCGNIGGALTNMYNAAPPSYWFKESSYAAIGSGWLRPDNSYDVAVSWIAPKKGSVTIDSTATLRNYTADGARVSITKNSGGITTTLIGASTLAYNNPLTMDVSSSVYVNAGDTIIFRVNKNTAFYENEYVDWNPVISFTLASPPGTDPSNLVSNPGFENETASPWSLGSHFYHTSADYYQGTSSVALTGSAGDYDCNLYQNITVEPYKSYVLEFYGKCGSSTNFYIMNSTWTTTLASGSTTGNNTWTKYTLKFESGNNNTIVLRVTDNNSGTNYFDDFNIYAPTNMVDNPGFENGSVSWNLGTHFTISTADKFQGSNSVRLLGTGNWDCNLYQSVSVSTNTNYTLRFYAKCAASTYFRVMNSTWTTTLAYGNTTGNNTWTLYTLNFNSSSYNSIIINVCDNNTSTNYFDSFGVN